MAAHTSQATISPILRHSVLPLVSVWSIPISVETGAGQTTSQKVHTRYGHSQLLVQAHRQLVIYIHTRQAFHELRQPADSACSQPNNPLLLFILLS